MRRPGRSMRTVLATALVFVPGAAFAQTTSTSSTTSSSTTSTVATTSTSTTMVNPCIGQPCTAGPPEVVLSTATARIQADQSGFCWRQPTSDTTVCIATARPLNYQAPTLVVTQGELVTVRFTEPVPGAPRQISMAENGVATPITAANPTSFRVTLTPGLHPNLQLTTVWLQGNVEYTFSLDVRRAATPATPSGGRRIALTG